MSVPMDIRRGDDETYLLDLVTETELPLNLSDTTVWLTIKDALVVTTGFVDPEDTSAYIQVWWKHDAGVINFNGMELRSGFTLTDGKLTVTLTHEQTAALPLFGELVYDVQVRLPSGKIKTWAYGDVTVDADVTNRTSVV